MGNKGIAIRNDTKLTMYTAIKMGSYVAWDTCEPGQWFIRDTGRVHMTIVAKVWCKSDTFPSESTHCDDMIEKYKLAKRDAEAKHGGDYSKNATLKYAGSPDDVGIGAFTKGTEAAGNPNIDAARGVNKYLEALSVMGKSTMEIDTIRMEEDGIDTVIEWDNMLHDGRNFSL